VAKLRVVLACGSFVTALTFGLLCASPIDAFAQAAKSATLVGKVDLNSASETELDKLPGVGKATAKKIIAGRPYQSVDDLSKAGVPKSTIEKLAPLVTVGTTPPPSTAATPPAAPAPAQSQKAGSPETTKPTQVEAKTPPAAGMVWVNTKSKVFHREGDRWYGKTKEGKFMTEADALKEGYRPSKEGAAKKSAKE
jgi:Helix-hairpin-helix motif